MYNIYNILNNILKVEFNAKRERITAMRKDILLNGEWDFMPIYEEQVHELPQKVSYDKEKIIVPSSWRSRISKASLEKYGLKRETFRKYKYNLFDTNDYPDHWNEARSGVLAKTIEVTGEMKSGTIILKFDGIMQCSAIYLNGNRIADWNELFLPLELDITDETKIGTNLIQVLCTEVPRHKIPSGLYKTSVPVGSWWGDVCMGIWQDVHLITTAREHINDVEIVTSVRNGQIDIHVETENCEDGAIVKAEIFDGKKPVKSFASGVLKDNAILSANWSDPIFWDTENPHLYNVRIILEDEGVVLDEVNERFGFREFWADGQNFMLNGKRVNLRGDSWHFQGTVQMTKEFALNWCKVCKENGVNSIRFHAEPHPTFYLDAADEMGILVVDETAIYGSGKKIDAGHPDYLNNCRRHIARLAKRDRNHASVVIWSLQNELRWVDGRDIYKRFVPEFINIFHLNDRSRRLVSLDGDNRLIDKAHTEVASMHYNIDGTIDQWDRKTPLTIGEHGGLWYITPQDSSMYMGMEAYKNHDLCAIGLSIKEQLFMEYARRKDVSGISSFNFAFYFAESMPNEDIMIPLPKKLNTPYPKMTKISKYALTINNGLLKDYPAYIPNVTCKYATAGMKPITVIPRQYNTSFFDDAPIVRLLDVYNDTLQDKKVTLKITAEQNGDVIFKKNMDFAQPCGERLEKTIEFMPNKVSEPQKIKLKIEQYHDGKLKNITEREYKVYPSELKTAAVSTEKVTFYGSVGEYEKFEKLFPHAEKLDDINKLTADSKLLIIGSDIPDTEADMHDALYAYVKAGGRILITEQFGFSFGDMTINKKKFLRAHASEYNHPVFDGLDNDDFMFWLEGAEEDGPDSFINSAFEKPLTGDYKILLECSNGDFNMGGDLWTPMLEYNDIAGGAVIASQLEIMKNFDKVPQGVILLRNMAKYLLGYEKTASKTGVMVNDTSRKFLDKITLDYEIADDFSGYELVVADAESLAGRETEAKAFAEHGGKLVILPTENADTIQKVTGRNTVIEARPTYHLEADYDAGEMQEISVVDFFGYDKVGMSPREVENRQLAFNTAEIDGAQALAKSVEGTEWYDLFILKEEHEIFKRPMVKFNKEFAENPRTYIAKSGNTILCQFITDENYEKSLRVYTRLLANLGAGIKRDCMGDVKGNEKNSMELVMALPYEKYLDYDRAIEYYTDPEFSLNNLGEGLYGWMTKCERRHDGYLNITASAGRTMFMTCFVETLRTKDKDYILELDANNDYELYINGEKTVPGKVHLKAGINRFFILAHVGENDLRIRPIFKNTDGTYATNIQYRLTVDEIDPK